MISPLPPGLAWPQSFFYTMIGEGQGLMIPLFFFGPSWAFLLLGPVVYPKIQKRGYRSFQHLQ
jgi:hypothetical protein